MSLEAKVLQYEELSEEEREEWVYHRDATFIQIKHNGVQIALHSDAMEPEDACFHRDLGWITGLVESAYKLGLQDAQEERKEECSQKS